MISYCYEPSLRTTHVCARYRNVTIIGESVRRRKSLSRQLYRRKLEGDDNRRRSRCSRTWTRFHQRSQRRSRGLRCRKEGRELSVIKAIFAGTLEEHGNTHGGNWDGVAEGERPFASENKTREIVIALKRSGRTTMTAADAASCGYRSSLDIKKSDRAILSVFIQRRPPAATPFSLSPSLTLSLLPSLAA